MTTSPYRLPCEPESHELLDMRSSGAAQRALDYYLKEEMCASAPNDSFFSIKPGVSPEEALVHASDLLRSAAATAFKAAENLQGASRDLAFSVVHMVDMARAMVDHSLDGEET